MHSLQSNEMSLWSFDKQNRKALPSHHHHHQTQLHVQYNEDDDDDEYVMVMNTKPRKALSQGRHDMVELLTGDVPEKERKI